jgi:hypothetical protein
MDVVAGILAWGFCRRSSLIRTSFLLRQRSTISPPPCINILLRYFQFQQRKFGMLSSEFRSTSVLSLPNERIYLVKSSHDFKSIHFNSYLHLSTLLPEDLSNNLMEETSHQPTYPLQISQQNQRQHTCQ